jgi:hypothetical protein
VSNDESREVADADSRGISRRAALHLAAGAGAAAAAAPLLARVGGSNFFDLANIYDLGRAQRTLLARPNWPAPPIITRAQWGANEHLRKPGQIYNLAVHKIVVHHTGTPNDISDYGALVRGIFANELNNGYIDVAYNWLIDPFGHIYEGRWAMTYPPGAVHTGERNHLNVQGAHALYFNPDTIGIGLMGDYSVVEPSDAMIAGLLTLMSWKCARWGIDPLGAAPYVNSQGTQVVGLANICGHRDTYATACPGATVESMLPNLRAQVAARIAFGPTGYWIASDAGQLLSFGNLPNDGGMSGTRLTAPIIGIGAHPSGRGYWLFGRDGGIFSFGAARFYGSTGNERLNQPMVGMAPTPGGNGYWLVARDGGVFCFGDARFYGSTGALRLNSPVLGLTPTPTGRGYWLVARDGGIFSFGDARFYGSTGGARLNQPIVGMAARPQGDGYWMVASDGGIFSFGGAPFVGSGASQPRSAPCVSITPSTTGRGYALLLADGSVLPFGDVPYLGSAAGKIAGPAVGLAGRLAPLG